MPLNTIHHLRYGGNILDFWKKMTKQNRFSLMHMSIVRLYLM